MQLHLCWQRFWRSATACSPKEAASNLILKTADLLGLREEGSDDDEADEIVAQPGGEVNFPDGLQDTSVHWNQQVQGWDAVCCV